MATTDQPEKETGPITTPAPAAATPVPNPMAVELADRSKYIRTMAKDMAALSGTPAPAKKAVPATPPKEETFAGVTLSKTEEPFFDRSKRENRDVPQETVALPSMEEAGSIVSTAPTPPPTPAPVVDANREAILERLRQKVSESAQITIQETPQPSAPLQTTEKSWPDIPTPPANFAEEAPALPTSPPAPVAAPVSEWQNIPAPAPTFAPEPTPAVERIPPVSRDTYREPIMPATPADAGPDRMHTYTSDFAKRIDTRSASTFSVLAAEQDSRTQTPQTLKPVRTGKKTLTAIAVGVLLIALGGAGIYATYRVVMTMRNTPLAVLSVPSIVFADEYRELSGTGRDLLQALATVADGGLVSGNLLVTYVTEAGEDAQGKVIVTPAHGGAFIRALQLPAPDILLRNIADESTVGTLQAGDETRPFFALRVDSYERTYAGMLTWEPLILRDLGALYPLHPARTLSLDTSSATTSATSTPQPLEPEQATALTRFSDAVVANHNVRILRDTEGRSLLLYGYVDKRTLLITRDEAAFAALIDRLKSE